MDTQTILQVASITFVSAVVFRWIGSLLERRKLQPLIEAERRERTTLEVRRQKEQQEAEIRQQAATARLAEADARLLAAQNEAIAKLAAAQQRIADQETELATARQSQREVDLKFAPMAQRIADLDSALLSERGRVGAIQTALDAKHDLAQQLAQELNSTRAASTEERQANQQRESALRVTLAEHEKVLASGMSQAEHVQIELDKVRAALTAAEQDAEAKLADAKRKIAAADQKNMLLQKEIMSLVSSGSTSHSEAAATVVAAEDTARLEERAKAAEKRAQELESKLTMSDSETRKKLRESEYRVCELEFKMAEMAEANAAAPVPEKAPAAIAAEQPSPEFLAKLHEDLAAAKVLCEVLAQERDLARGAVVTEATAIVEEPKAALS